MQTIEDVNRVGQRGYELFANCGMTKDCMPRPLTMYNNQTCIDQQKKTMLHDSRILFSNEYQCELIDVDDEDDWG